MKKLAIVGAEETTRHLAPYDDPEFDIWVFNEWANAEWCKRWDALLQIHEPLVYRGLNKKDPNHWEWLRQEHGKPIYMQTLDPEVPDAVLYPLDEINARFMSNLTWEGKQQKYIRATVSFAYALALYLGYDDIHVYGVELASHAEYRTQRDNFIFWNGVAVGQGARINLHCCKGLFDMPLYGFEPYIQEDRIQRYMEGLSIQREEKMKELNMIEGALQVITQMLSDIQENIK